MVSERVCAKKRVLLVLLAAAGTTIIVPAPTLALSRSDAKDPKASEAQMAQFSLRTEDAPELGPAVRKGAGSARVRRGRRPPFSVKVLVDEKTMNAQRASLLMLTLAPANRIAMHRHPGAEVLYVKKGRARVLGPRGVRPEVLPAGTAIFIPAGMPHVIENMVRTQEAEILQIFAPLGPERVYRDPNDEKGRASFEIVRDQARAKVPDGARFVVKSLERAPVYSEADGSVKVHLLFDPGNSDSKAVSVSLVEFQPGVELPLQNHKDSVVILYILSGAGEFEIGSNKLKFASDQAIRVPEDQPYSGAFTGAGKTIALQIYAPAGPEQRLKLARSKSPAAPNRKQ